MSKADSCTRDLVRSSAMCSLKKSQVSMMMCLSRASDRFVKCSQAQEKSGVAAGDGCSNSQNINRGGNTHSSQSQITESDPNVYMTRYGIIRRYKNPEWFPGCLWSEEYHYRDSNGNYCQRDGSYFDDHSSD